MQVVSSTGSLEGPARFAVARENNGDGASTCLCSGSVFPDFGNSADWVSALSGHRAESVPLWHPSNKMTMSFAEHDSQWPVCRNG